MSRATLSAHVCADDDHGVVLGARLAWMIDALHRGIGFSRLEYAARYGLAIRSFRRDVDTLRLAGLRVVYDGPTNRYAFARGSVVE